MPCAPGEEWHIHFPSTLFAEACVHISRTGVAQDSEWRCYFRLPKGGCVRSWLRACSLESGKSVPSPISCVTSGKSLYLSEPHLSHTLRWGSSGPLRLRPGSHNQPPSNSTHSNRLLPGLSGCPCLPPQDMSSESRGLKSVLFPTHCIPSTQNRPGTK